ncbi:hypothetical protein HRbin19_00638 [bacterium HR19]|nr:hypothetical protein HRbin19_00638 [bacterium HR19]
MRADIKSFYSKRTFILLTLLNSILCIRFFIFPALENYSDSSHKLKELQNQYEELKQRRKFAEEVGEKLKIFRTRLKNIQDFKITDWFDEIEKEEKEIGNEECQDKICSYSYSSRVVLYTNFADFVSFLDYLSKSPSFVYIKSLKLQRDEKGLKVEIFFEVKRFSEEL